MPMHFEDNSHHAKHHQSFHQCNIQNSQSFAWEFIQLKRYVWILFFSFSSFSSFFFLSRKYRKLFQLYICALWVFCEQTNDMNGTCVKIMKIRVERKSSTIIIIKRKKLMREKRKRDKYHFYISLSDLSVSLKTIFIQETQCRHKIQNKIR